MIAPSRGIVTEDWLGTPVLISATFPGLPLLRRSSDVVRARIAKASVASQNIASAVAVVERVILAIPINGTWVELDHRTPRSLGALRVSWIEAYRCKSSGSHQNRAYHYLSTSMQGLVITPRRPSLVQYVVAAVALTRFSASTLGRSGKRAPHWIDPNLTQHPV